MIEFASEPLVFIRTENVLDYEARSEHIEKAVLISYQGEVRENKKAASRVRNDKDK